MASLREQWQKTIKGEGGHCPTCDRWGRIYGRNINKTMATSLLWLTQAPADKDGWVDVPLKAPRWLVRSNQHVQMKDCFKDYFDYKELMNSYYPSAIK